MKILVGTDLSARSETALRRARVLASHLQAELAVAHVVDSDLPPAIAEVQRTCTEEWLSEHVVEEPGGPRIELLLRTGDPHSELAALVEELGADLLVLGGHRSRLLVDTFIGTTAERLLRVVDRPVLIVHNDGTEPYRRVLAATDLSDTSARALRSARTLDLTAAPATVVYVFHAFAKGKLEEIGADPTAHVEVEHTRAAEALTEWLSTFGFSNLGLHVLLREGRATEEIPRIVEELDADLLVLGTKGLTGVRRAVLGSVAGSLVRSAPCDVLAVPPASPDEAVPAG